MFVFSENDLPVSAKLVKARLETMRIPTALTGSFEGNPPEEAVAVFTTNAKLVPGMAKLIEDKDPFEVPVWAQTYPRQMVISQFSDQYFEQFGDGVMEVFDSVAHKILTT
jgi:hypothetical protein